ncbi:MAG TPA: terminase family protein [Candidatus Paceibacterota bacterium]
MAKARPNSLATEKQKRLEYLLQLKTQAEKAERQQRIQNVFQELRFTPNPGPQTRFLDLPDKDLDVLYGGAVGGGKSVALLAYALRSCVKFDGLQVYWFRCTYPELDTSVIKILTRDFGLAQALGAKWISSKYELVFPNGSVLKLTHAKNIQEATSLRSAEINLLILDERTTIPPNVVELLYTRIRSGNPNVPVLGIRSATNPGGPGHATVLDEYIRATDHGKKEIEDKFGRRRIFIQSKLTDTPQLMNDGAYLRSLQGLEPDLKAALLEGDWERFSGQMFSELSRERHIVTPMVLPETWRRYSGVDYGWRAPWAVIWGALDEDGRVWLYREIYETQVKESDQAKKIIEAEANEEIICRYADDAMWVSRGEAKSIAKVYEDEGCHLTKAGKGPNSRKIGFSRIHNYLADGPACNYHREMGLVKCPMLHMFSTCRNMFDELKNIAYATSGDMEDSDPKYADHLVDALRYLLINIGNEPRWHFDQPTSELISAAPRQESLSQSFGGYPVMPDGGDPWSGLVY